MNLITLKKDNKNVYRVFLILCLFNIPIFIFVMIRNFSVVDIVVTGLFLLFYEMFLAYTIDRVIFISNLKNMDNAKRLEYSKYGKKRRLIFYIFMTIAFLIFLYLIMLLGDEYDLFPFGFIIISNFINIFNSESTSSFYIGDNYLLYGERLIEKNKIIDYDVKTRKKGKDGKRDKIGLVVHIINSKDIEIYGSRVSYKMKEVIDEIQEDRFIKEKMVEYGVK